MVYGLTAVNGAKIVFVEVASGMRMISQHPDGTVYPSVAVTLEDARRYYRGFVRSGRWTAEAPVRIAD